MVKTLLAVEKETSKKPVDQLKLLRLSVNKLGSSGQEELFSGAAVEMVEFWADGGDVVTLLSNAATRGNAYARRSSDNNSTFEFQWQNKIQNKFYLEILCLS